MRRSWHTVRWFFVVFGFTIACALSVLGFGMTALGFRLGGALIGIGLMLFVVAAWLYARPRPSRTLTDISAPWPWGPDRELVDFSRRLERRAGRERHH